ncbi:MAG: homocysteine S-methyltransferase family protein, partial [Chloroflexota bacterium]|nr:homocysteine S-methyltransferase family protein [Chloroflexota bacterium]
EWTEVAVALAHEAVELAGDRRPAPPAGVGPRAEVVVCGSMMAPDILPGTDPDADALHAHAETIAEAGVDVLLVEQVGDLGHAQLATLAAAATGVRTWSAALLANDATLRYSGDALPAWVEVIAPAQPERMLLYGADVTTLGGALQQLARLTSQRRGACIEAAGSRQTLAEDARLLLERGATLLGLASEATPATLQPLRETVDEQLAVAAAEKAARTRVRQEWLLRAAEWAPGGPALWLGDEPDLELPGGFEWTVAPGDDLRRLPEERYRLLVVGQLRENAPPPGAERLLRLLDRGGVVVGPTELIQQADGSGRVLDRAEQPPLAILMRD